MVEQRSGTVQKKLGTKEFDKMSLGSTIHSQVTVDEDTLDYLNAEAPGSEFREQFHNRKYQY